MHTYTTWADSTPRDGCRRFVFHYRGHGVTLYEVGQLARPGREWSYRLFKNLNENETRDLMVHGGASDRDTAARLALQALNEQEGGGLDVDKVPPPKNRTLPSDLP